MKNLIPALCLLVAGPTAFAQQSIPCPLSTTIIVDGKANDWPINWIQDKEKMFSYNVCADEQLLYVRVMTSDYFTKRKMAAFGFTLWLDPEGKKKKKLGLRFPTGGAEAEERAAAIRDQGGSGSSAGERADYQKEIDRQLIINLEVLELIGLSKEPITSARSGIMNGIKVAIDMDSTGAYVYEAIIPFKSFRISRAAIKEMSVGFETGKYIPPKTKTSSKSEAIVNSDMNAGRMTRYQGYQSLMGNPKLTYPTYAWASLNLK